MIGRRTFLFGSTALLAVAARPAAGQTARRIDLAPQGSAPVTAAFQAALVAAAAEGRPLLLGAGTYTLAGVRLPDRARIEGVPGLTRLQLAGRGPLFLAANVESVRLEGLVLDGLFNAAGAGGGLVAVEKVASFVMDDCTVERASGHGLVLEASGGRIERSRFAKATDAGIFARDSRGLSVLANTVEDCGNGGILIWRNAPGEDGTIVQGNRISKIRAEAGGTGQNGNGINVFRAGGVLVSGNWIADCAFTAVRANSASNVQIIGNHCLRSGETALYAEFSFEGAVIANNLVDGAANGISVTNFNEGGRLATVTGNLVRNLKPTGPYKADPPGFGTGIAVEADTAVTGNTVENAPVAGIWIGFGRYQRDVVVDGNVLRNAEWGIAASVAEGAGPALIRGNLIRAARRGAIVGFVEAKPTTGDLAVKGAEAHPHLTIEGNRVAR